MQSWIDGAPMSRGGTRRRETQHGLRRALCATLALALSVVPAAACRGGDKATPAPNPVQANPVRHDLDPLTKRFPAIGNPTEATWMSGTLGDPAGSRVTVPGPSVYWIEAIITLRPDTAHVLRTKYAPNTAEVPQLNENLRGLVPPGPYLTSKAMDKALSNTDWSSTTYLAGDSNTLIIKSVDD